MSEEPKCIFNCKKKVELTIVSDKRCLSIIKSSEARKDNTVKARLEENKAKNVNSYFHRTCISSYTSKTHIKSDKEAKKRALEADEENNGEKRARRSDTGTFNFKKDCIFCGYPCLEKEIYRRSFHVTLVKFKPQHSDCVRKAYEMTPTYKHQLISASIVQYRLPTKRMFLPQVSLWLCRQMTYRNT